MRLVTVMLLLASLPLRAADISRLNWLTGCWAYDGKDAGSGEYWMSAAGGTMFAVSRSVRNGKTVGIEYLQIKETDTESLLLIASPSGQTPTEFNMISQSSTGIVFENSQHDFPQRIIYRLSHNGTLLGRIEGKLDDNEIAIDFPMTRTTCGALGL